MASGVSITFKPSPGGLTPSSAMLHGEPCTWQQAAEYLRARILIEQEPIRTEMKKQLLVVEEQLE